MRRAAYGRIVIMRNNEFMELAEDERRLVDSLSRREETKERSKARPRLPRGKMRAVRGFSYRPKK